MIIFQCRFLSYIYIFYLTEMDGGLIELTKVAYESSFNFQEEENSEPKGHYLTFSLPYGGSRIQWEVLFDRNRPANVPDLILVDPESLMCDPNIYLTISEMWNIEDPLCLSKLLPTLKLLFSDYHVCTFLLILRLNS